MDASAQRPASTPISDLLSGAPTLNFLRQSEDSVTIPPQERVPAPEIIPASLPSPTPSLAAPRTGIVDESVITAAVRRQDTSATSTEQRYQRLKKIKNVAFFGYADAPPDSQLYKDAYNTARRVAEEGLVIVDGGGPGVMAAATRGAESVGGRTITVTFYPEDAPGFEGRYVGNVADLEIITRNYIERMHKLMEYADAYIIFNGGTGTISEFGTAWVMARLYFGRHKPFLLYGDFWKEVVAVIERTMMMRGNENDVFRIVNSPDETMSALQSFDTELEAFLRAQPGSK